MLFKNYMSQCSGTELVSEIYAGARVGVSSYPWFPATCHSALHSDWYQARWMSSRSQVTSASHLLATDNEYDQHQFSKIVLIRDEMLDW